MAIKTTTVPALDDAIRLAGQLAYTLEQIRDQMDSTTKRPDVIDTAYCLAEACRLACELARGPRA